MNTAVRIALAVAALTLIFVSFRAAFAWLLSWS